MHFPQFFSRIVTHITNIHTRDAKKLILLMLPSFIVAVIITTLWYFLEKRMNIPLSEANTADSWSSNLGFVYAAIVAIVLAKVESQHHEIKQAIKSKNAEEFKRLRDLRISRPLKMIMGILSFFMIWHTFLTPHESTFYGINQLFSITFFVGAILQVAREMDDPFNGIWLIRKEDLPKDWQQDKDILPNCFKDPAT